MWRSAIFSLLILCVVGCGVRSETSDAPTSADSSKSQTIPADDAHAVAAIETLTSKLRRDGNGSIVEVDFRGVEVTDGDLEPLTKLPNLRSVLLLGTGITDAGLQPIGTIASLENLDLRDCKVSNVGLARLSSLPRLKSAKAVGKKWCLLG